jgi:hypothetical protein
MDVAQERVEWRAVVNTVMNYSFVKAQKCTGDKTHQYDLPILQHVSARLCHPHGVHTPNFKPC